MRRTNGAMTSDFYCTCCGRKGIPIARKNGKFREAGHLKSLYCIYCKKEVNHCEIRPIGCYTYDDFKQEYELGRFVDGNRKPVTELISCSKEDCKYNIEGKCWNDNHSFKCGHRVEES